MSKVITFIIFSLACGCHSMSRFDAKVEQAHADYVFYRTHHSVNARDDWFVNWWWEHYLDDRAHRNDVCYKGEPYRWATAYGRWMMEDIERAKQ